MDKQLSLPFPPNPQPYTASWLQRQRPGIGGHYVTQCPNCAMPHRTKGEYQDCVADRDAVR